MDGMELLCLLLEYIKLSLVVLICDLVLSFCVTRPHITGLTFQRIRETRTSNSPNLLTESQSPCVSFTAIHRHLHNQSSNQLKGPISSVDSFIPYICIIYIMIFIISLYIKKNSEHNLLIIMQFSSALERNAFIGTNM